MLVSESDATSIASDWQTDLVLARKGCRLCMTSDPGIIHAGANFEFDPDVVSYWSQWLGHRNPEILIVAQDFGDIGYFERHRGQDETDNKTNNNLHKLLVHIGFNPGWPPTQDPDTPVFLTNSILCLKSPPMNRSIKARWVRCCADMQLVPLVETLSPRIVVGMGSNGWLAIRHAFGLDGAPKAIGAAAGSSWQIDNGPLAFAVGHCGPLGLANRPWSSQLEDWTKIGRALDALRAR